MGRGLRLCVLYFFFLASLGGWGGKHSGGLWGMEKGRRRGGGIELRMMINAGGIDGICGANKKYPGSDSTHAHTHEVAGRTKTQPHHRIGWVPRWMGMTL